MSPAPVHFDKCILHGSLPSDAKCGLLLKLAALDFMRLQILQICTLPSGLP